MSTKSREVIFGSQIAGAKIRAEETRKRAAEAVREAEAWSIRMEGYGGPAQPSPTIGQCLNGGYGWLQVNAGGARPRPACHSSTSAGRGTRRFGSSKRR